MTGVVQPAPHGGRVAWMDLARALSITLVVLYHVAVSAGGELLGGREGMAAGLWRDGNLALIPLRMPLFFVIAGALAAGALHRPWSKVIRPRILDLLWPYVLWSLLFAVTGWPRYAPGDPVGFVRGEITGMLVVGSPYWFIAALPVFFLLTRLLRSHRAILVLLALAAFAVAPYLHQALLAAEAHRDLVYGVFQLTDNALWYVAGYALRDRIVSAGERARPLLGILLTIVFCAAALIVLRIDLPLAAIRSLELLASVVGISACIALLPLFARQRLLARLGSYLGSRTLVIYLVHPIVLNVVVVLWRVTDAAPRTDGLLADLMLIPAVTALAIIVSLAFDAVIDRWGLRWLTAAPARREMRNSSASSVGHPGPQ